MKTGTFALRPCCRQDGGEPEEGTAAISLWWLFCSMGKITMFQFMQFCKNGGLP